MKFRIKAYFYGVNLNRMQVVYFYNGLIGRYALQDTDGVLTRMWVGNRVELVPQNMEIKETPLLKQANTQLEAYFSGQLQTFTLPVKPQGTDFQLKVWAELCRIPYGQTITYGQLAERVGNKNASRAVGMANGRNPLPVFIPCHRVIGTGGKLTGYTGGLDIKQALLKVEGIY